MDQLKKLLASLSLRQKIVIASTAVAVIVGLLYFTNWRKERDFRPLYTGMAAEDANAVMAKIRESGVEYRLSQNGTTILVPSARVDEIRLQMAGAGLPKTGRVGYELFDKTNFGVTDFAEQVNYHRAIEGELERSVMAMAEVEQVRVHVTFPKDSVFLEAKQPAKASVMVKLKPGRKLSQGNVMALCQLTASAVEGLSPEAVSVLDMNGTLLSRPRRGGPEEQASEAALEYRQRVEKDLLVKINSTLEPLLGPEKYKAGVSVDCDITSGEQSEETFDPTRSVMLTSQKTEDVSGVNLSSGQPGTASNLPRPTSRPGASGGGTTRRTENMAYQTSRVVKHTKLPQGSIKRMSVSVLLDQSVRWEGVGAKAKRILDAPSPEKIKVIRDLLAAATGFVTERGDQLIVESLPFEATLAIPPPPGPPPAAPVATVVGLPPWVNQLIQQKNPVILGAIGGGFLVFLLLVFFLFRKRAKRKKAKMAAQLAAKAAGELASGSAVESAQAQLESKLAEQEAMKRSMELEAINSLRIPVASTKKSEVLAKHLSETAKSDPAAAAQILRTWIYDND